VQAKPCTRDFCHKNVNRTDIYAVHFVPYIKSEFSLKIPLKTEVYYEN